MAIKSGILAASTPMPFAGSASLQCGNISLVLSGNAKGTVGLRSVQAILFPLMFPLSNMYT